MPEPLPVPAADLDEVVALLAREQADPARGTCYLGEDPTALVAELDALDRPWRETLRVVRDGGAVVGAVLVTWDPEVGRSWVYGPWVAGGAWDAHAGVLLDAALAQVPAGIVDHEVGADVGNGRLAALASGRGWHATEPSHVYGVRRADANGWPASGAGGVRTAAPGDLPVVMALHDAEFPATYATARHLLTDPDAVTLVVTDAAGAVRGYASGHVEPDGSGYLDFLAVDAGARGLGLGAHLLRAAVAALFGRAPGDALYLTVEDRRRAAVALYEAHGFARELTLRGYRSVEPPRAAGA